MSDKEQLPLFRKSKTTSILAISTLSKKKINGFKTTMLSEKPIMKEPELVQPSFKDSTTRVLNSQGQLKLIFLAQHRNKLWC